MEYGAAQQRGPTNAKHIRKTALPPLASFQRFSFGLGDQVFMSKQRAVFAILFVLLTALVIFLCLFGNSPALLSWDVSGPTLREMEAIFRDPGTQWMVFLCVAMYYTGFLFLQHRQNAQRFFRSDNSMLWLIVFLTLTAIVYFIDYTTASESTHALTLAASIPLGLGIKVCSTSHFPKTRRIFLPPAILICFLLIAALWQPEIFREFGYRGRSRWSGPWDNPNIYGLLMGTGVVLAFGGAVFSFQFSVSSRARSWKLGVGSWFIAAVCFVAAVFMCRGLFHSFSRGAWVATGGGLCYLMCQFARRERKAESEKARTLPGKEEGEMRESGNTLTPALSHSMGEGVSPSAIVHHPSSFIRRNLLPIPVIVTSVLIFCFWQFRQTEWRPARRALSVANANDFSGRNRVAAWEGALQIAAERPFFGAGWNQPEILYENYYLPSRLTETAAIQMNDYLILGATLGVPALFCFGMYIWLSLFSGGAHAPRVLFFAPSRKTSDAGQLDPLPDVGREAHPTTPGAGVLPDLRPPASEFLAATCRAGVDFVGTWIDSHG
jgi:hypothetical protein